MAFQFLTGGQESMELEKLQKDRFVEYLHSEFQVVDEPANEFAIRLEEVSDRTSSPHQEVFALLFHGSAKRFLNQGIHKLRHSQMGEIDIFLVPVGQDQHGFHYEAIFNHLID